MENYPSITKFGRSLLVRVLVFFGMITASIISWWVIGYSTTFAVPSSPVPSTNIPSVKITPPHKGQQVPVGDIFANTRRQEPDVLYGFSFIKC